MTDREKLIALLNEFDITPDDSAQGWVNCNNEDVVLMSGKGNVDGYSMFYCIFEFNKNGSFKSVGVWE